VAKPKTTKEIANAAGKLAAEKAAISWSGLTDIRAGYTLTDGEVHVPIPQNVKFCDPPLPNSNRLEPNTSPSALNATKGLYNAIMDQREFFKQRGVKHAAYKIPQLDSETFGWLNGFISFQKQDASLEIQGRYGLYNSDSLRRDLYYFLKK